MTSDCLLSVFHLVKDQSNIDGCLSIYYSSSVPTLSFVHYSNITNNLNLSVFPFSIITKITASISDDKGNTLSVFLSGQPVPNIYSFCSKYDVWTFLQVTVANGIISAVKDQPDTWSPSGIGKPVDPVEWIFENSPEKNNLNMLHSNSGTKFSSSLGASFSLNSHRNIIRKLIIEGKKLKVYNELLKPIDKNIWENYYNNKSLLQEYLTLRKQWELRINEQKKSSSQHNKIVQSLVKKSLEHPDNEHKKVVLVYNVIRTMITFAPDLNYDDNLYCLVMFMCDIILDDDEINKATDEIQSKLFWCLNTILFDFGLSQWYVSPTESKIDLVNDISDSFSSLYPAIGFYICYDDYSMFNTSIDCIKSLFVNTFDKGLVKKVWNLLFKYNDINPLCPSIIMSLLLFEFPELTKSRIPDLNQISNLFKSKCQSINNEEDFLAILSLVSETLPKYERFSESISSSCKLFHPISFD